MDENRTSTLQQTLMVLIGLGLLTAVEFIVAGLEASSIALLIIALLKAGIILNYFMQITGLWSEEHH